MEMKKKLYNFTEYIFDVNIVGSSIICELNNRIVDITNKPFKKQLDDGLFISNTDDKKQVCYNYKNFYTSPTAFLKACNRDHLNAFYINWSNYRYQSKKYTVCIPSPSFSKITSIIQQKFYNDDDILEQGTFDQLYKNIKQELDNSILNCVIEQFKKYIIEYVNNIDVIDFLQMCDCQIAEVDHSGFGDNVNIIRSDITIKRMHDCLDNINNAANNMIILNNN